MIILDQGHWETKTKQQNPDWTNVFSENVSTKFLMKTSTKWSAIKRGPYKRTQNGALDAYPGGAEVQECAGVHER